MDAKNIVEFLKTRLGVGPFENLRRKDQPCIIEHDYAFGSTEVGFYPDFEIDYAKLEQEMDAWIKATFNSSTNPAQRSS